MKPQCTTAAECLRELARVMEQFGIEDPLNAVNSKYIIYSQNNLDWAEIPLFKCPQYFKFAIAEVEGKPVFIGDELYMSTGVAFKAYKAKPNISYGEVLAFYNENDCCQAFVQCCSWNPPRPKTVMVELTVEDAEFEAGRRQYSFDECAAYAGRKEAACKKALGELK